MSFRRAAKDKEWSRWVRENREELTACGLPPAAYHTEKDWYLFLDHGYIQSTDLHISDWWSINALTAGQADRLRLLLIREYGNEYLPLVSSLETLASNKGE